MNVNKNLQQNITVKGEIMIFFSFFFFLTMLAATYRPNIQVICRRKTFTGLFSSLFPFLSYNLCSRVVGPVLSTLFLNSMTPFSPPLSFLNRVKFRVMRWSAGWKSSHTWFHSHPGTCGISQKPPGSTTPTGLSTFFFPLPAVSYKNITGLFCWNSCFFFCFFFN